MPDKTRFLRRAAFIAALLVGSGTLAACGQTGPLYLPPPKPKPAKKVSAPVPATVPQTAPSPSAASR